MAMAEAAMDPGLEALAARVRVLEDESAIRDLKARYLRACDLQRPEDVRATLVEDAVVAYEGFPEFTSRDSFVDVYAQMGCQPGIYDIHHGANAEISIDGDRATGRWSLFFQNINVAQRTVMQMAVEYEDVYVRLDEGWLIAETRTRRTSFLLQTVDEDGTVRTTAMGEPPATFG